MMNLLNGLNGGGFRWASVGRNFLMIWIIWRKEDEDLYVWIAARTTQRPNSRVIREKNDMEVIPFYCVAIHDIDTNSMPVIQHTLWTMIYRKKKEEQIIYQGPIECRKKTQEEQKKIE